MLSYFTNNKKLLHYIICVLFMFFFRFIPPVEPLTAQGMAMVGVFIGTVYGWIVLDMLWPSMLSLVAMSLTLGTQAVLAATFGNSIIMMMIVMLILMEFLNSTHTTEYIAVAFLNNKFSRNRPWLLVLFFFLGVWACSIINPIVALMMFMGFLKQICQTADIPLRSKFTSIMAIGMGMAALMGQASLPFYNAGLSYTATYAGMFQTTIPYFGWIAYFVMIGIAIILLYTLLARFVFRVDISSLAKLDTAMFGEKKKLDATQKIAISGFLTFVIIVIAASFIPQTTIIGAFLTKITSFGQVLLILAVLMLMIDKDGKAVFNFRANAASGISWDVVFMVAVIMALAQFLTGADTGVTALIAVLLRPIMGLPVMVFIVLALLLGILLTNFANNFVVALVIMPVLYSYAMQTGISPMGPIMALFVSTQIAIGTPGASFPIGICYSYADIVDAPQMMKYAWITVIFLAILCVCIALPLGLIMFS